MNSEHLIWHDALDLGVEGKGWDDTVEPYDRLPRKAQSLVPKSVWVLSQSSTGMCVRFRTGATAIHARWSLLKKELGEANFNRCADSGLDLYGDDNGTWRWIAATCRFDSQTPQVPIVEGLDGVERDYLLYLPLRNKLASLEVGAPADAGLKRVPPRTRRPLVVYGTSIVHGAYASRCGMVYPSILGRRLQRPVINLGFSGSARMEIELADLLAELEAAAYILDPFPNMTRELVDERLDPFVRRLRECRPATPIVLVEDFPRTNSWILPEQERSVREKCRRCREILDKLGCEGINGLHIIQGDRLLGDDNEASIDGIHPGDLGFTRMADIIEPVLNGVLVGQ
ncbi:MAG: SGNH/GDSL hydrolase family protein [Lentisphaeria bacterium]|nr:SGNH/GDSL hydrolase family protein [Lentisphaeria bacterium]